MTADQAQGAPQLATLGAKSGDVAARDQLCHVLPTAPLIMFALVCPLSVAVAQVLLYLILATWIFFRGPTITRFFRLALLPIYSFKVKNAVDGQYVSREWRAIARAGVVFLVVTFIASAFGVSLANSAFEWLKGGLYFLFAWAIADIIQLHSRTWAHRVDLVMRCLAALVFGQVLAGLHTIVHEISGFVIPPAPPGPVTESGQLVLSLCALFGLLFSALAHSSRKLNRFETTWSAVLALFSFIGFIVAAWLPSEMRIALPVPAWALGVALVLLSSCLLAWLYRIAPNYRCVDAEPWFRSIRPLFAVAVVLGLAFVFNLKRGPWVGVFTALTALGLFVSRRFAVGVVLSSVFFAAALPPARERIVQAYDHFAMVGGRSDMWQIGSEIAKRYPLGLGLKNVVHMRELDPSLPPTHRHMHSNPLNIVVETGWMGLAAYLWFMYVVIRSGVRRFLTQVSGKAHALTSSILALTLSLGILGSQIAGLGEYNFGDAEIRSIFFLFLGLILVLVDDTDEPHASEDIPSPDGQRPRFQESST